MEDEHRHVLILIGRLARQPTRERTIAFCKNVKFSTKSETIQPYAPMLNYLSFRHRNDSADTEGHSYTLSVIEGHCGHYLLVF